VKEPHCRSAQVWHALSRDFTVLPAPMHLSTNVMNHACLCHASRSWSSSLPIPVQQSRSSCTGTSRRLHIMGSKHCDFRRFRGTTYVALTLCYKLFNVDFPLTCTFHLLTVCSTHAFVEFTAAFFVQYLKSFKQSIQLCIGADCFCAVLHCCLLLLNNRGCLMSECHCFVRLKKYLF